MNIHARVERECVKGRQGTIVFLGEGDRECAQFAAVAWVGNVIRWAGLIKKFEAARPMDAIVAQQ